MAERYSLHHTDEVGAGEQSEGLRGDPNVVISRPWRNVQVNTVSLGYPLQKALTSRFFSHVSTTASFLCPAPTGLCPQINEINPPADESLICSPSQRYLQRQLRPPESPKPSRSDVKHNRFPGVVVSLGLKFSSFFQITPYRYLTSNILLNGLSLVFSILKDKGRVVTNCDISSRIRPPSPIPSEKRVEGWELCLWLPCRAPAWVCQADGPPTNCTE